jgi:hypothetical protein
MEQNIRVGTIIYHKTNKQYGVVYKIDNYSRTVRILWGKSKFLVGHSIRCLYEYHNYYQIIIE